MCTVNKMKLILACLVLHFSAPVLGQAGTTSICVPSGTCINRPGGGTSIDPRFAPTRIVTPPATITCGTGQESCAGIAGAVACGQRYVTNLNTADGNVNVQGGYPWQAYLMINGVYGGSGVLVDSFHIITAAHKVNSYVNSPASIQVYMGVYVATNLVPAQMRPVSSVTLHGNFNSVTLKGDIAILRVTTPFALGYQINVGTACLPAANPPPVQTNPPRRCVVSGWGQTAFTTNDAGRTQKQVTVPIVPYTTCRASMTNLGVDTNTYLDQNGDLCAGGEAGRDACTQDGGSPLVCLESTGRYSVAGLVIWGKECGRSGVYGVYVDVAKYRPWIDTTIATLNRNAG